MISLFSTGDFVRIEVKESWYGLGRNALLMGFALIESPDDKTFRLLGLVSGQDGNVGLVAADDFTSDFIYDAEKDRFIDRSAEEPKEDFPEGV